MGQTLSEPITEKETEYGENDKYYFAVSAMQGWRITMEDAHAAELCFTGDPDSAFFGVYDGHGGTFWRLLRESDGSRIRGLSCALASATCSFA